MFLFNKLIPKKENNNIRKLNLKIDIPNETNIKSNIETNEVKDIVNLSSYFNENKKFPKSGWMFNCQTCGIITSKTVLIDNIYEINICPSCQKKNNYIEECNKLIYKHKLLNIF